VLAVIVEKIITALPDPRARAPDDIASARLIRSRVDVNGTIPDELRE
jgi:hypothetical protein